MLLYNFERLIKKYGVSCLLEDTQEGEWIAGEYETGQPVTKEGTGAIVPINEKRVISSGGFYKQGDCEFITTKKIVIHSNTYIIHKGNKYKLENNTDYGDYADFYVYTARGASAFARPESKTENNAG